jgi:hypothetical protein
MDFESNLTMPIYSDNDELIGSFVYDSFYDKLQGFVAGVGHPLALAISTGDPVFFTPTEIEHGCSHAVLTQAPISVNSRVLRCEPNEEDQHETKK